MNINSYCPPSYFFSQTLTPSSQQTFLEGISSVVNNSVNTIINETLIRNLSKLINEKVSTLSSKEQVEITPILESIKEVKDQQFNDFSNFCLQFSLLNDTLNKKLIKKSNALHETIKSIETSAGSIETVKRYQRNLERLKRYKGELKGFIKTLENCKKNMMKDAYNSLNSIIDHTN